MLKFQDNLFIAQLINQDVAEDPIAKVEKALGIKPEERKGDNEAMGSSFYRKEGLDFLSF